MPVGPKTAVLKWHPCLKVQTSYMSELVGKLETIIAELKGSAMTCDAQHIARPDITGASAALCMQKASKYMQVESNAIVCVQNMCEMHAKCLLFCIPCDVLVWKLSRRFVYVFLPFSTFLYIHLHHSTDLHLSTLLYISISFDMYKFIF